MRVNVDGCVLGDPRFKRLGKILGVPWTDAIGRCLLLWFVAYERRTPIADPMDIDIIAERDGFADAMLEVGLAWPVDGGIHIAGVRDRIQFLIQQTERGRKGGHASQANARASAGANAKRTPDKGSSLPPDPSLDLPPAPDHPPTQERERASAPPPSRSRPKGKAKGCSESELASAADILSRLSERSGRKYGGSEVHVMLVVSRLRAGFTTWDLRRVIGYCAIELDWENKPDMQPFLRPETLFGPKAMEKYIYAARAWMPQDEPQDAPGQRDTKPDNVRPAPNGGPSQPDNVIALRFPHETANDYADPAFEEPSWLTTSK